MNEQLRKPLSQLELDLGSEIPTERAPEEAAKEARVAAKALVPEDVWCDSEAPTGVAAERPIFPPPPRKPRV
jgi:hypothetical protein